MHPKPKTYPTAPTPSFPVRVITVLCFASLLVSFVAYRSGYWEGENMSASMIDSYTNAIDSNINPKDSPTITNEPIVAPSSKSAPAILPKKQKKKKVRKKKSKNKKKKIMYSSKSGAVIEDQSNK